jgi:hypothetical protein
MKVTIDWGGKPQDWKDIVRRRKSKFFMQLTAVAKDDVGFFVPVEAQFYMSAKKTHCVVTIQDRRKRTMGAGTVRLEYACYPTILPEVAFKNACTKANVRLHNKLGSNMDVIDPPGIKEAMRCIAEELGFPDVIVIEASK